MLGPAADRFRPDVGSHGGVADVPRLRLWGHMSTTDLPGPSLLAGRYRLVERLGAGGMSVVWRGFDEVLGRQVAVKVLPQALSANPSFRRRLRAEAQAAARLSHPHITNVYDYGEAVPSDGTPVPFVVMELIDGVDLLVHDATFLNEADRRELVRVVVPDEERVPDAERRARREKRQRCDCRV